MSDSDSESGDGSFAPNQALPVANLPWNYSGEPQDGLEYLFTVRRDSKKLPRYTRVLNPFAAPETNHSMPVITANLTSSKATPAEEWRSSFISQYKRYRQNMKHTLNERTPKAEKQDGTPHSLPKFEQKIWWNYISGDTDGDQFVSAQRLDIASDASEPIANKTSSGQEPSLWILKRLSTRNIMQLLWWHSVWLDEVSESMEEATGENTIPTRKLTPVHQRWMFNLLSILDDNLVSDDISTLRVLARACLRFIVARLTAQPKKDSGPTAKMEADELEGHGEGHEIGGYWMIVAAIVGIWGQFDIWDEGTKQLASMP